jgi:hypothetical protein
MLGPDSEQLEGYTLNSGLTVVYVGPAAAVHGGVSALLEKIVPRLSRAMTVRRIATYVGYTAYDKPYRTSLLQVYVFVRSLVRVALLAVLHPRAIFHVHLLSGDRRSV